MSERVFIVGAGKVGRGLALKGVHGRGAHRQHPCGAKSAYHAAARGDDVVLSAHRDALAGDRSRLRHTTR